MSEVKEKNELEKVFTGLKILGLLFNDVAEKVNSFVEEHKDERIEFATYLENFEDIHSEIWKSAAANGWFSNSLISIDFIHYVEDKGQLDEYMASNTRPYVAELHSYLIAQYPERKEILDIAFDLHNQGNYIAAIPLFLAQTDGICAKEIGCFLFSEHDRRYEKIEKIIKYSPESSVVLAPLLQGTQFGASISKKSKTAKSKAPNRNGILHGSSKHLDYGTEMNSLKSISLLSYIADAFH